VGDVLAAAESALGQDLVERRRLLADMVREHLPLHLSGKIGAGRRSCQKELRRFGGILGHGASTPDQMASTDDNKPPVEAKREMRRSSAGSAPADRHSGSRRRAACHAEGAYGSKTVPPAARAASGSRPKTRRARHARRQ